MSCTTQHLKDKPEIVPVRQLDAPVLIPLALALALVSAGCGSAQAATDPGGGTIADLVRVDEDTVWAAPDASDGASVGESPAIAVADYALRAGYQWKEGWWWLDLGDGVLHALFEEVDHYGVGVMMPSAAADSRISRALERMAQVFADLEPDADFLSLALSFFDEEQSDFQDLPLGQHTTSTTLNGRELEAVRWRTTSAQGSAMGFMLIIQKR